MIDMIDIDIHIVIKPKYISNYNQQHNNEP